MCLTIVTKQAATPTLQQQSEDEQARREKERDRIIALLLLAFAYDEEITPDQVSAATDLWRSHVPKLYGSMLMAGSSGSGWTFNQTTQSYRSAAGTTVNQNALKQVTLNFTQSVGDDLRTLAREGFRETSPNATPPGDPPHVAPKWATSFARIVRQGGIAITAAASGGVLGLTPTVRRRLEGNPRDPRDPEQDSPPTLAFTEDRLAKFAGDVAVAEERAETENIVASRAEMYAAFLNGVFEDAKRESHRNARDADGTAVFLYERNILGVADHCRNYDDPRGNKITEGCIEVTAAGWKPIGTLPNVGERTCKSRCLCSMQYSIMPPDVAMLKGFDPSEARDDHGRWTGGGSASEPTYSAGSQEAYQVRVIQDARDEAGKRQERIQPSGATGVEAIADVRRASRYWDDLDGYDGVLKLNSNVDEGWKSDAGKWIESEKRVAETAIGASLKNVAAGISGEQPTEATVKSLRGAMVINPDRLPPAARDGMLAIASKASAVASIGDAKLVSLSGDVGKAIKATGHLSWDAGSESRTFSGFRDEGWEGGSALWDKSTAAITKNGSSEYKQIADGEWMRKKDGRVTIRDKIG